MKKMFKTLLLMSLMLMIVLTTAVSASASGYSTPLQFDYRPFHGGQTLAVYSGPGFNYWRGANGWAKLYTDEPTYVAGWDGNWLLVVYGTNSGSRTGYVCADDMADSFREINAGYVSFEYSTRRIRTTCTFTDDTSSMYNRPLGTLYAGDTVTYLTSFYNGLNWAYIETVYEGKPIRAFVPMSALQ